METLTSNGIQMEFIITNYICHYYDTKCKAKFKNTLSNMYNCLLQKFYEK